MPRLVLSSADTANAGIDLDLHRIPDDEISIFHLTVGGAHTLHTLLVPKLTTFSPRFSVSFFAMLGGRCVPQDTPLSQFRQISRLANLKALPSQPGSRFPNGLHPTYQTDLQSTSTRHNSTYNRIIA